MFGRFIRALIYVCFLVLAFYIGLWVVGMLGLPMPYQAIIILKVILALIVILILYQLLWADFRGYDWWGRGANPPGP